MVMKKNVGRIDRVLRIVIGLVIIGAGVYYHSWWGAIGALPLLTAVVGWCPPYALLGIDTCKGHHA
jgi:Inner membrane protein YgaP-like, transmembrane domain